MHLLNPIESRKREKRATKGSMVEINSNISAIVINGNSRNSPSFSSHPTLSNRQPLIYFLSVQICPFQIFYISGIIQYMAFCDCIHFACFQGSSMFQHVSVYHSFLWPWNFFLILLNCVFLSVESNLKIFQFIYI